MKRIRGYDSRLLILNLLMLMPVAFVPFPSSVISEYPGRAATIFYALTMTLLGMLLAAVWAYAAGPGRLTDPGLDASVRRRQLLGPLLTTAVFLLSIPVAFVDHDAAK